MYAVIKTGGKQYRLSAGDKVRVEQLAAEIGAQIKLEEVLLVGEGENVQIGTPCVAGAYVNATVLAQGRGKKINIFKMRRRKHFRKSQGHRQNYTELEIGAISLSPA